MKQKVVGALLVTWLFALGGCGAGGVATMVRTTPGGGELELSGQYMNRVADAVVLMASHCEGQYAVVDEHAEGGYTEAPAPEQTHVEFVCVDEVAARQVAAAE